jgi:hypothetical protein
LRPGIALPAIALLIASPDFSQGLESNACGLGHEVQSLPDVRRPEARSAQIRRPDGVTRSFQISRNNVEPSEAVFGRNLLAKDCVRV